MYDSRSNLIIGFHGCDKHAANSLINNPDTIKISAAPYEWLGHGMYFWENNQERARQWAVERQKKMGKDIADAAVVGAILQLRHCCDLMDSCFTNALRAYYEFMTETYKEAGKSLPVNRNSPTDTHKNKLLRELDCSVIEYMHQSIMEQAIIDRKNKGYSNLKIFDSTRGVFIEGDRVYNGAEIFEKTHIQICIRNPNCIKGFFLPRKEIDFMPA